jgi:hypothetical protein
MARLWSWGKPDLGARFENGLNDLLDLAWTDITAILPREEPRYDCNEECECGNGCHYFEFVLPKPRYARG